MSLDIRTSTFIASGVVRRGEARPDTTEHPPSGALLDAPGGGGSAALFAEQSAADGALLDAPDAGGSGAQRPEVAGAIAREDAAAKQRAEASARAQSGPRALAIRPATPTTQAPAVDLPARRNNAQRRLAEARREEFARMAAGRNEQRAADAREHEALEDAHRQRVAASITASATLRLERELRQAPETSEGERGAAVESVGHAPHDAPVAQPSVSRGPPADTPTASQLMVEPAEMAEATSLSLETAATEARNTGDAEATLQAEVQLATARSAITWASEASTWEGDAWELAEAVERSEADATALALADDTELAKGVQASLDEGGPCNGHAWTAVTLADAEAEPAAQTPLERARTEAGIARLEKALQGAPSQARQREGHAIDETLARALQGSLEISHPPERLRDDHIEAARRLGIRSPGMTWLLEAEAATAANATNRAPNEAPGNLPTTSPSEGQAW